LIETKESNLGFLFDMRCATIVHAHKGVFIGHPRHAAKYPEVIGQAAQLMAAGKIQIPVAAVYPLTESKALGHAKRGGKVPFNLQDN
jgi:NADPH:quinone reductase-like Zn-dependent oxidoreductase